jgi:hypothetical protein
MIGTNPIAIKPMITTPIHPVQEYEDALLLNVVAVELAAGGAEDVEAGLALHAATIPSNIGATSGSFCLMQA